MDRNINNSFTTSNHINNKNELMSMLNIIKEMNVNENEKLELFDSDEDNFYDSEIPEYQEKINIHEVINNSQRMNESQIIKDIKIINNLSMINKEKIFPTLTNDNEIYTFDPKYREKIKDFDKTQKMLGDSLKMENSYVENINNQPHIKNIINQFKQEMIDNILLINIFSENLSQELNKSIYYDTQIIYERSLNSIFKIKNSILEIFNKTEKEIESQINNLSMSKKSYENENPFRRNHNINKLNNSVYELAKTTNFTTHNKSISINNESMTKNPSINLNPNRKLNNEIFNENKSENIFSNIKTKEVILIDKIKNDYNEKLEKLKNDKYQEINKLKITIKNHEDNIESSKNLIDEIYSKNRMLHDRLLKYKMKYENDI